MTKSRNLRAPYRPWAEAELSLLRPVPELPKGITGVLRHVAK